LDIRRHDYFADDTYGPSTYREIDKLFQDICRETSQQKRNSDNAQPQHVGTRQESGKPSISIPLGKVTSIEHTQTLAPKTVLKKSHAGSVSARGKREATPKNNKVTWPQSFAKDVTKTDLGDGGFDENQNQ